MTLNQLEYFVAICRNDMNITKTAKLLHITQPGLSNAISNLETEFNVKLFNRDNKHLYLTREGELFLASAATILNQTSRLSDQMTNLMSQKTSIRLGIAPMVNTVNLAKVIGSFHNTNQNIKFDILSYGSIEFIQLIQDDLLDFAIVNIHNRVNYLEKNILVLPLYKTELAFCTYINNPLANKKSINLKDIENEPLVLIRNKNENDSIIKMRFANEGLNSNILFYLEQVDAIKNFVKSGYASTFLFADMFAQDDMLTGISFDTKEFADVGIIYKKSRHLLSNEISFVEYLKENCINDMVLL